MKQWQWVMSVVGLSASLVAAQQQVKLIGVGSNSFKPVVEQHIKNMNVTGLSVEYIGGTTGESKKRLLEGAGDFAVLEVPFTNEELKAAQRSIVHVPIALSATVMAYNLPDLKPRLRLSRKALGDIFLGKITRWNDARLAQDNPGANLPDLPITLMLRTSSSPSSTIANLTDYLAKISSEWAQKVSRTWTFTPKWPAGNVTPTGISKLFTETPGALTYYDVNAALTNKFNFALLENASGKYIDAAERKAVTEAAADKPFPADARTFVTDAGGNAYPLVGMAWIAFPKELKSSTRSLEQSQRLLDLVAWSIHDGQALNEATGFGRIPQLAILRGDAILKSVTYDSVPLR
jgi:phosphate transport system substrate-binding protein